jgi:hypothetical protein
MKRQRTKHPAPVLFGERMKLALTSDNGGAIWVRVYGDIHAEVDFMPEKDPPRRYRYVFAGRVGFADTLKAAVRLLESMIRRTGRALPWAATVSRSFARSHGR